MFSMMTPYEIHEIAYRREELRRAWGHGSVRAKRRVVSSRDASSSRVALAC